MSISLYTLHVLVCVGLCVCLCVGLCVGLCVSLYLGVCVGVYWLNCSAIHCYAMRGHAISMNKWPLDYGWPEVDHVLPVDVMLDLWPLGNDPANSGQSCPQRPTYTMNHGPLTRRTTTHLLAELRPRSRRTTDHYCPVPGYMGHMARKSSPRNIASIPLMQCILVGNHDNDILHIVRRMYGVQYTIYSVQCTVYTACTLYTVYSVRRTAYDVRCFHMLINASFYSHWIRCTCV